MKAGVQTGQRLRLDHSPFGGIGVNSKEAVFEGIVTVWHRCLKVLGVVASRVALTHVLIVAGGLLLTTLRLAGNRRREAEGGRLCFAQSWEKWGSIGIH